MPGLFLKYARGYNFSAVAAILGFLGLIGWLTDHHALASFGSYYIPMSPVVALEFVFLGSSWFVYARVPASRPAKRYVQASVLVVSLIDIPRIVESVTGIHTGIENYLVREVLALDPAAYGAGPMSPVAAGNFLLACGGMISLLPPLGRRFAGLSSTLAFIMVSVNLTTLLGYLYGTPLLYGGEVRPVALPVGVAFLFLGAGLIAEAGPAHFPLRELAGPSVRAILMRTFLSVVFVVAVTDGLAYNLLLRSGINQALLSAVSVLTYVVVAGVVVSGVARVLGGSLDRADLLRRQAEEELRRNKDRLEEMVKERTEDLVRSNAELEQFAYVAAHDLKEPLLSMASALKLLERRVKDRLEPESNELIADSISVLTRMQALITDLLAYSRVGAQKKPFELSSCSDILHNVLSDLRVQIEQTGAVLTSNALPEVMADPVELAQLFQNLISNAVKFRGDGPVRIHISAERKGEEWVFSVSDSGIGIPEGQTERIFEIFHRLHKDKYPGTGIGLATCKKIVSRHGGRIWVESQPGKGAAFFFTIPAEGGTQAQNAA